MANQPVTPNTLLDKGFATLEATPKNLPVTVNTLLDKGYVTLEPPNDDRPVTANVLLDMGFTEILLGPHLRDRTPFGTRINQSPHGVPEVDPLGLIIGFEVFTILARTVDPTTVVVQVVINWGSPETVYDGSAGGYQAGYTGTDVPASSSLEDWITFSFTRDAGWNPRDFVRVLVFADDDLGQSMDPPQWWEFQIAAGTVVTLVPGIVPNTGGVQVSGTSNLPNGTYEVRITGGAGPVCYGGADDTNKPYATVLGGAFTCWIPPLAIGTYKMFFTDQTTSDTFLTNGTPLEVIASEMRDKDQRFRQVMPPQYVLGPRNSDLKGYPQS